LFDWQVFQGTLLWTLLLTYGFKVSRNLDKTTKYWLRAYCQPVNNLWVVNAGKDQKKIISKNKLWGYLEKLLQRIKKDRYKQDWVTSARNQNTGWYRKQSDWETDKWD